jgi:hypothetical protein
VTPQQEGQHIQLGARSCPPDRAYPCLRRPLVLPSPRAQMGNPGRLHRSLARPHQAKESFGAERGRGGRVQLRVKVCRGAASVEAMRMMLPKKNSAPVADITSTVNGVPDVMTDAVALRLSLSGEVIATTMRPRAHTRTQQTHTTNAPRVCEGAKDFKRDGIRRSAEYLEAWPGRQGGRQRPQRAAGGRIEATADKAFQHSPP